MNCYPAIASQPIHPSWDTLARCWGYDNWLHFKEMVGKGLFAALDVDTGQTVFIPRSHFH